MSAIVAETSAISTPATPEFEGSPEAAPGLVICATVPENRFLADLVADTFRFPSGEMVSAAAGLFPAVPGSEGIHRWHRGFDGDEREYRDHAEGPLWRVEVAPGLVRLRSFDANRSAKTLERNSEAKRRENVEESERRREEWLKPMVWSDLDFDGQDQPSRFVSAWSRKSRANLVSTVCELDLRPIVSGEMLPCMLTFTLPGDWLAVAPDAATIAKKFDNFTRSWEDRWGPLSCIWKREFQGRFNAERTVKKLDSGRAPHWHLWTVPPVPMHQMGMFREWLSQTWTDCLQIEDQAERARSLAAGTGVDFAEGLRARDPKRLAIYFLKESLGGEGKAYQNQAPPEWAGQSVGRFWGVRKIDRLVAVAPVHSSTRVELARTIRRWQKSQGNTELFRDENRVVVREDRVKVTRQLLHVRTKSHTAGTVQFRTLRRPVRTFGASGWLAVNNGASFAGRLARAVGESPGIGGAPWHRDLAVEHSERLATLRARLGSRLPGVEVVGLVKTDPPWLCTLPAGGPVALAFCPSRN
jgi:hypothetical protein